MLVVYILITKIDLKIKRTKFHDFQFWACETFKINIEVVCWPWMLIVGS